MRSLFALAVVAALASSVPAQCSDSTCDVGCDSSVQCDGGLCDDCAGGSSGKHRFRNLFKRDCCARPYVSMFSGWNDLDPYNGVQVVIPPVVRDGTFNEGWLIGGSIGQRINRAVRIEGEFAFRDNTADQWIIGGVPAGGWNGHFNTYSLMTNLIHDFDGASLLGVTPYLGGGIGIAFLEGNFTTSTLSLDIDDEQFAFQLMAGGSLQVTRNIELFSEFRYFATTDFTLMNTTTPLPVEFGTDPYETENVILGLRIYR